MKYRTIVIPVIGVIGVLTGFLLFGNLNQNLVYYLVPSEAVAQSSDRGPDQRFRLGGLVQKGSVVRTQGTVKFTLTDAKATVPVIYKGVPGQLFAAGIGAVVEGQWRGDTFYADTMLVKHDQNYRVGEPDSASSRREVTR